MKNKRFLSMVLAVVLVASLLTGFAATASADGDMVEYSVKSGDYMYKICKNQGLDYYSCKNAIMILNGFTSETQMNRIYVGQKIKLPASNAAAATVKTTTSTTTTIGNTTVGTTTTTTVASGDSVVMYLIPHTVRSGETLYSICNSYETSYDQNSARILEMNGIKSVTRVFAGKVVYIPVTEKPSSGAYYSVVAHKIQSGDTLTSVCNSYGMNYSANATLVNGLNKDINVNYVKVGQTVYVPTTKQMSSSSSTTPSSTTPSSTVGTGKTIYFNVPSGAKGSPYATVNGAQVSKAEPGKTVTINPNPNSGYVASAIVVTNRSTQSEIKVTNNTFVMPDAEVSVKMTFSVGNFTITTNNPKNGSYSVLVNGGKSDCANNGDKISLNVVPDYGYQVDSVTYSRPNGTDPVTVTPENDVYSFLMPNHNVKISVNFKEGYKLSLVTNKTGNGSVTYEYDGKAISNNIAYANSEFIVKFKPMSGYGVNEKTLSIQSNVGTLKKNKLDDNTYSLKVVGPVSGTVTVSVDFVRTSSYSISFSSNTKDCTLSARVNNKAASSAKPGEVVSLVPVIKGGYDLDTVTVRYADDSSFVTVTNNAGSYEFTMPPANVKVYATFKSGSAKFAIHKYVEGWTNAINFAVRDSNGVERDGFAKGDPIFIDPADYMPAGYVVDKVYISAPKSFGNKNITTTTTQTVGSETRTVYRFDSMPNEEIWLRVTVKKDTSASAFATVFVNQWVGTSNENHGIITLKVNGNNLENGGTAIKNSTVSVAITPDAGYEVEKVNFAGVEVSENADGTYSHKITDAEANTTVYFDVFFAKKNTAVYTISYSNPVSAKGLYEIWVNGVKQDTAQANIKAAAGDEIVIYAKPSDTTKYKVGQFEVDGKVIVGENYSFTMPSHDVITKVTFAEIG